MIDHSLCWRPRPTPAARDALGCQLWALKPRLRRRQWAAWFCLAGWLSACHAKPAGQVLARVDGHDVTAQDVAAEARAAGVAVTRQDEGVLLGRVVDRQLLADAAHRQRLDLSPASPADLTRLIQNWRAQLLVSRLVIGLPSPTSAQIQAYISSHPAVFQDRTVYKIESYDLQTTPTLATTLQTYQDLDLAVAFLNRLGIKPSHREGVIDTAQVAPELATKLAQTPDNKLVIAARPGRALLSRILARRISAIIGDQAIQLARERLRQQGISTRIDAELRRLRATSHTQYQPGHAPPIHS